MVLAGTVTCRVGASGSAAKSLPIACFIRSTALVVPTTFSSVDRFMRSIAFVEPMDVSTVDCFIRSIVVVASKLRPVMAYAGCVAGRG